MVLKVYEFKLYNIIFKLIQIAKTDMSSFGLDPNAQRNPSNPYDFNGV